MGSDALVMFVACGLPVLGLGFFLWLLSSGGRSAELERRIAAQDDELRRVRMALRELHERLSVVEAARIEAGPATEAPTEPAPADEASTDLEVDRARAETGGSEAEAFRFASPPTTSEPTTPAPLAESAGAPSSEAAAESAVAPPAEPSGFGAPSATPSEPTAPSMSLEQWLGVRGAAALGGILIAIAGAYWFQYSIEHGLVSPRIRVVIGVIAGLACLVGSESRLRTHNVTLANFLAGAGTAVLYFAFWAASARYGLVPTWLGMGGMAFVTAVGCVLAARRSSLPTALLSLGGGFATPIVLSTGEDRPLALFSYLFVLDAGLIYLARTKRWGSLAVLSLIFTVLYEAGWVGTRMGPHRVWWGLLVVSTFGVVFGALSRVGEDEEQSPGFRLTRSLAVLVPFTYGLHLALSSDLPATFLPVGVLLLLLNGGAAYLSRRDVSPVLGTSAAAASIAVLAVYLVVRPLERANAWWIAVTMILLGVLHTALDAWDRVRALRAQPTTPELGSQVPEIDRSPEVAVVGSLALVLVHLASSRPLLVYPALVSVLGLGAVLAFLARSPGRAGLHYALGVGVAWGLASVHAKGATLLGFPPEPAYLVLLVATAAALSALGAFLADEGRVSADRGATVALLWIAAHTIFVPARAPFTPLEGLLVLGAMAMLAIVVAARRGHGLGVGAMSVVAAATAAVLVDRPLLDARSALGGAVIVAATTAILAFAPWLGGARLRASLVAHRGASLAAPLAVVALAMIWDRHVGDRGESLVALGLALLPTAAALLVRRDASLAEDRRKSAFVWHATAALALLTLAIPLELDREWITVGWALQGVAVLALWRSVDHAGLKAYAALLFAAVFVRLCLNPAVLGYHRADGLPIVNWLAYTYLVPAAAMLGGARMLRPLELERYRPIEKATLPASFPALASGLVLLSLIVIFAWINLAIVDAFSASRTLELPVSRMPARDLAISVSWAVYALVIVAVGVYKNNTGLRITSLALLLLSCGKLFLYDLGNLKDLYRVFALLGLALALIVVSFAYQRFVFRRNDTGG